MNTDTRDPLVPDPEEQPPPSDEPVADEVLSVPRHGLEPREGRRKRAVVIGAGMAGLVAALELARQGHDPLRWTHGDLSPHSQGASNRTDRRLPASNHARDESGVAGAMPSVRSDSVDAYPLRNR